jgi:hypothetical protein
MGTALLPDAARPRPDGQGAAPPPSRRLVAGQTSPCPACPPAGEYGGRVPCGSGWAVPACLVGWSEPGNQAKGGDTW